MANREMQNKANRAEANYRKIPDMIRAGCDLEQIQSVVWGSTHFLTNEQPSAKPVEIDRILEKWRIPQTQNVDERAIPEIEVIIALAEVMTAAEVQKEFGLAEATVRQAINRGTLTARKSGETWLVLRKDAEARWGNDKAQA